jgi:hypothetical protein
MSLDQEVLYQRAVLMAETLWGSKPDTPEESLLSALIQWIEEYEDRCKSCS